MEDTKNLEVSVIILNWNTRNLLANCLDSLIIDLAKADEIIVVDNASTDGSVEMVKKNYPQVKLIVNKKNVGFSKGNNIGFEKAKKDYIFFLNSDTLIKRHTISKLVTFLSKEEKAGAVSPVLYNEDRTIQQDPCYLKQPSIIHCFLYYNKILRSLSFKYFPKLLLSAIDFAKDQEVEQLPGAALLVKKNVLDKIGVFDEQFPIYFEDNDLSLRIRKSGLKLFVVADTYVTHFGRKSIEPVIKKEGMGEFYYLNFRSLFLFCQKNYSTFKTFFIKLIIYFHLLSTFKFNLFFKLVKK